MRRMISTVMLAAVATMPGTANAQAAPAPTPSPASAPTAEADALGKKVAEGGMLAALLPLAIAKDVAELVGKHPELDAAGKDRLRATAMALGSTKVDALMTTIGHQYALRLSLADLKALAAFNATEAASNRRAAEPLVIASSMKALDGFDLQKTAWAQFCKDPAAKCVAGK